MVEVFVPLEVPIIPMRLFTNIRGFVILNILSALSGAIYIGLSIIWPTRESNRPRLRAKETMNGC